MEDRDLARLLAWGRIGIGMFGALMPARFMRMWTGRMAPAFPTDMATRGLAVRDLAIGAGLLHALDSGGNVKPWLQASAASDAADAIGTLTSFKELGPLRSVGLLGLEVGAAIVGLSLADSLDD